MMQSDRCHGRTGRAAPAEGRRRARRRGHSRQATASPASWRWSRSGPPAERYGELLDVVQLYHATRGGRSAPTPSSLELTGSEAFVLSCLRALERFEIARGRPQRRRGPGVRHWPSRRFGRPTSNWETEHDERVPCGCTTTPTPTAAASSGRTFAIIGYGSQGHAHALNLRDSGARVDRRPPAGRRLGPSGPRPRASTSAPVAEAAAGGRHRS